MLSRKILLSVSMCIGLGASSLANAQSQNALTVPPTIAPTPVAPLTGANVVNPVLPGTATFLWNVVSNADQYRLRVTDSAGNVRNFRFTSNGTTVNDNNGNVVCSSATILNTQCEFRPTNLGLADGEDFFWQIGARNSVIGGNFRNSPRQFITYLFSLNAATALSSDDLFRPRGNVRADSGNIRQANPGQIAFHWRNFIDASSFVLRMRTIPENNLLPDRIIPLNDPDLDCDSVAGIFDACTFLFDPEAVINNQANDFCWSIQPVNASGTTAPVTEACYTAL